MNSKTVGGPNIDVKGQGILPWFFNYSIQF